MMSRAINDFKDQQHSKKLFQRSQSATKVKNTPHRTNTNDNGSPVRHKSPNIQNTVQSSRNISPKVNTVTKDIHSQEEYMKMLGKKAENNLMGRPVTSHDLTNRLKYAKNGRV